jgi:hypothetical protein
MRSRLTAILADNPEISSFRSSGKFFNVGNFSNVLRVAKLRLKAFLARALSTRLHASANARIDL